MYLAGFVEKQISQQQNYRTDNNKYFQVPGSVVAQ
jgi:hypothetical protein